MNVCVFGAASMTIDDKYIFAVEKMGEFLAKRGHNLVFGSGSTGSMGAASRGFKAGGGKIHGVVPEFFKEDLSEYVNFNCDEMTFTKSMHERKAIMEELSQAFIITPGGIGTYEEFFEVLTLKQLGRHKKPIAIYNVDGYFDSMNDFLEHSIKENFVKESCRSLYKFFDSLDELAAYIENDNIDSLSIDDLK